MNSSVSALIADGISMPIDIYDILTTKTMWRRSATEESTIRLIIQFGGRRSRRIVAGARVPLMKRGFCLSRHHGKPVQLALAEWLEELAVCGNPRSPKDSETAWQLSQAIENWYLVQLAVRTP